MIPCLSIVADDLTGAADCSAGLLARGRYPRLVLSAAALRQEGASVAAVDLAIREAGAALARESLVEAVAAAAFRSGYGPGHLLYLKADSALRGPFEAFLEAAGTAAGPDGLVVVAPAFPEVGRTVADGRVLAGGVPLERSPFGAAAGIGPAAADVLARTRGVFPGARHLVEGDEAPLAPGVVVADAIGRAALDRLAAAATAGPRPLVMVGSGGLVRSLAPLLPVAEPARAAAAPRRPVLWVIGSAAGIAHEQAARLDAAERHETPDGNVDDATRMRLRAAAQSGRDACLVLSPPAPGAPLDPRLARRLAGRIAGLAASFPTVFSAGGGTARALAEALGVKSLTVVGEPMPGVVVTETGTAPPCMVLKSGSFGGADALARIDRWIGTTGG